MAPTLYSIIVSLYIDKGRPEEESLVFPNKEGKAQDRRNLVRRSFERIINKAGLRRIRFHDLRHTFAALCIEGGTDIKTLQALMGHSSIKVTMDVYGHLYKSSFERAIEGLESVISMSG
jgi:integrase